MRRTPHNYDLIALDLDGTLLDRRDTVPERNRAALHRAHEAGIKVVLCTGRAFTETRPILGAIGLDLDATITVFGALLTDARSGATLDATPMDDGTAHDVAAVFAAHGYPTVWLCDRYAHGYDGVEFDAPRRHRGYDTWRRWTNCEIRAIPHARAVALPPALRVSIIGEECDLEQIGDDLRRSVGERVVFNTLRIPSAGVFVVEAFAAGVSKWSGIEKLCRRWDIDPRRTAAVGDEVNDVEMIRAAGLGVAMGNANPLVKEIAGHITATNEDCGVAAVIDRVLSNEL